MIYPKSRDAYKAAKIAANEIMAPAIIETIRRPHYWEGIAGCPDAPAYRLTMDTTVPTSRKARYVIPDAWADGGRIDHAANLIVIPD